jgi:uncharacterized protein DUF5723
MKLNIIFTVFFITIMSSYSFSDDRSNARGIGLSNASMVSSIGINAYGVNPANFDSHDLLSPDSALKLGMLKLKKLNSKPLWEISIMSVGGGYGSDSTMDFYNHYIQYLTINRETFKNLFTDLASVFNFRNNTLPNSETDVNYDFELKWFSVNFSSRKIGAINFTISDKVGLNTSVLGRDQYMPLNFGIYYHKNGSYDLTNVNLHQSEAVAWWIRKYNIAYARQIDMKGILKYIKGGISIGLVHGFGDVITYNSTINLNTYGIQSTKYGTHVDSVTGKQNFYTQSSLTDFFKDYADGAESHFTFFPKPAGKGYSIDLGVCVQIGEDWNAALSITEIGKITWNYNTIVNLDTNSFIYRDFILSTSDPTYNQFVNDLDGLDTRDVNTSFTSSMPTKYRAGIMYRHNNKLLFELDWVKGDNNLPSNTTRNIFSLGAEYYAFNYLPLRAGLSIGGPESFNLALGAGLKFRKFIVDFASNGINHILNNSRLSLSLSGKILLQ